MVRGVWKMYMEISSNVVSQFNRLGWAPQIHDERLEITSGCQNTLIGNFIGRVIFQWVVPQHLGTLWRWGCPSFGMKDVSFSQKGVPRQKCSAPSLSENFFPYHETWFFLSFKIWWYDYFVHALVVLTIDIGKFFLGNTSWKATAFRRAGSCRIWTFRRKCPSF